MTSPPVFPTLPGQGWSIHKKPTFSTLISAHTSGREVRDSLYQNPIWSFELTFNALDGTPGGQYGGVGPSSLQTLLGLFLQCQGQYGAFLYYDPTDYSVTNEMFGTGDGVTTSFPLTRSLGGFSEPVIQPLTPTAPTLFPIQGSPTSFAPNNLLGSSGDFTNSIWAKIGCNITAGLSDPFGANNAQTMTATTANCSVGQSQPAAGDNYVSSVWIRRRSGSGSVTLSNPADDGGGLALAVTSSWSRFYVSGPPASGQAANKVQLSTLGDSVDLFGAQIEQSTIASPGPYFQTLATAYFGGPWITVSGAIVDATNYTLANGVVSFATAPSGGAVLAWTGYFAYLCRFEGDDLDFEQFMANLWRAESVRFRSLRPQ